MSLEYDLYIKNTFKLAKTLVIKSEVSANFLNAHLIKNFGSGAVNLDDKTTWKYYLNISGEYHSSDIPMYVSSIDNEETILFSKSSLSINNGTLLSYMYGSVYYDSLVAKYPNQELLIMGILYPVDIFLALNARDGQILNYPSDLVQGNEYTLMRDLQTWIFNFSYRWDVYAFNYSDNLYAAAQLAIMYLNIPAKILNLRLARCKTLEAHSYHIDTYLASNNNLNTYIDYLTLKQKMFLYRNIKYIQKYAGSTKIFNNLIQKLLSDIGMPIYGVDIRKKLVDLNTYKSNPICRTVPLGGIEAYGVSQYYNTDEILTKEIPDAFDNKFYYDKYKVEVDNKLTYSLSNFYKSKVLLSNIVDYDNPTGFTIEDVLINNFGYLSYFGMLKISTPLTINTGNVVSLSSKDAFFLMIYLTYSLSGIKITKMPTVYLNRVLQVPLMKPESIMGRVGLSDSNVKRVHSDIASTLPSSYTFSSVQDFKVYSDQLFTGMKNQYLYTSLINDLDNRAYVQFIVERFYADFKLNTLLPDNISEWLVRNSVDLSGYGYDDYLKLLSGLVESATGYTVDSEDKLQRIQTAVMSALKKLSSYSIQPIYSLDYKIVNAGNLSLRARVDKVNIDNAYIINLPDILGTDVYSDGRISSSGVAYFEFPTKNFKESVYLNSVDSGNKYSLINQVPDSQRQFLESVY